MSYINTPIEIIAEDLLIALLGLPYQYTESEGVCLTSAPMEELLEGGVTFSIVTDASEEQDEKRFRVVTSPAAKTDTSDVDCPWWTTSGDDPVIHDQYYQADLERSAGGWSDVGPEAEDDHVGTTAHCDTWSEWRLYIKRAAETRRERVCRIFDWLRRQPTAKAINSQWWRFRQRNRDAYKAFRASNDTSKLWLTKKQKDALERYYRIRLRQLP